VLEEKLEEARMRSGRRRKLVILGLFATISLCILVLIGLSSIDFSTPKNVPVVVSEDERLNEIDIEKDRGEFKEILQEYENELEPRLLDVDAESWNRDSFFEIQELKKRALADFASGEYGGALGGIKLLKLKTLAILEEAEQIFQQNLEKGFSYWEEDLYDEAKLHVEKALMVAPGAPEALELQEKVEKLPIVLPLLDGAKVARAENDLQKEYDFLQQVLQITPERDEAGKRLELLGKLIKNKKLDTHIAAGYTALENRQAKEARNQYREAKKIDPKREELIQFLGQLQALEKSLRVQREVKLADQAVRRDDWLQARKSFVKAAKDAPDNKKVVEGLKHADQVLDLQARFAQYFSAPYRLANSDVRLEAEKTLMQATTVSGYSFGIKRQAAQLSELINKINRLIPVTIDSDNKTYVSIRSVGRVGAVSQKIIKLKPGNYTFEGTRDGFKAKLLRVLIPYDKDVFSVRVICDEPI
jgi:hypothetical protein